jgi:hypothetical protein
LALERAPVQASCGVESEHLVHKPNDAAGRSLLKLNNRIHHAHALAGEARQPVVFRVIEQPRELCAR